MHAATDRLEFAPPQTPGMFRSLALAVLAHVLLVVALTLAVQWKSEPVIVSAEAELWSAMPQQAAPKLAEVPPEPAEPPEPPKPPVVKPLPKPPTPPTPPQVQPKLPDANIALEREKLRIKKEKLKELEDQRLEKLKLEKVEKLKQEKLDKQDKQEKLDKLEKLKQEKLLLDKKKLQDKRDEEKAKEKEIEKRVQDKKVIDDKKKKSEQDSKRKEALQDQQDAKNADAQRSANLKRMAGLAGATGSSGSTGTALHSSGPSASYAGKLQASIKPNIVFVDNIAGNPKAEVEVRTSSDGTIISRRLIKSSGEKSWDDAVLRAIDKTGKLPRDVDGRVPSSLEITFRPKD